ncbi:Putative deoxyribonuclease YcfH [hydrothermal vent metagenome]|uniref:Deoxyribonuclease YcfH n=1 Tax=hydrothermal vent metagenome TaxID=652676 RepID=A0A3B1EA64_9ZZZZ
MPVIIDTHCHLDSIQYKDDVDSVIQDALLNGVKTFLIPGASLKDLPRAVMLSEKYDEVFFAVGVHPYDKDDFDFNILEKYVYHPKCVAIGECGLDYFRLPSSCHEKEIEINLQKEIFIKQIQFAKKVNKPLIIHIRDASNDSKQILIDYNAKEVGGVLHCFNAHEDLLELNQHNFYFGVGGVVTFKNAKKLTSILNKIPLEKLLIETDSPYLTPHPFRGKRNEPKFTCEVVEKISEILEIPGKDIKNITTHNAKTLFKEFSRKN